VIPPPVYPPAADRSNKLVNDRPYGPKTGDGMIPTTCFSRVSFRWLDCETREFLSEIIPPPVLGAKGQSAFGRYTGGGIKERFDLKLRVLLNQVVG